MTRILAPPQPRDLSTTEWAIGVAAGVVALVLAAVLTDGAAGRVLVAVVIGLLLGYLCLRSPRLGVCALLVWLALLGLTRRLGTEILADPSRDPLLVVAPFASGVLCARALLDGAARARRWLANGVAAFSVVTVVAVLNPRQETVLVGLAGLLVWLAPMLYFWIGRRYVDLRLADRVLGIVGVSCVLASAYGLVQAVVAFPPWDQRWIDSRGYGALYIGPETVRPFGVSSSAAEFALVAAFGCLWTGLVGARALRRHEPVVLIVATSGAVVSGAALVLSAVRTVLVMFALAAFAVYLVRRRNRVWVAIVVAISCLGLVVAAAQLVEVGSIPNAGTSASVRRVVVFFQDPLGGHDEVTTNAHLDLVRYGIEEGFRRPLGSGTGSTTRGADQFGDEGASINAEADIANAGLAFGVVGMLLVAWITLAAFVLAIRRARRQPDLVHLAILGLLLLSVVNWWNGGHYFMSAVLWLLIGWSDSPPGELSSTRAEPEVAAHG